MRKDETDVVAIGAGTAGSSSAIAAREKGAKVIILEKALQSECGGNGRYTGGGFRFWHKGTKEIIKYLPDIPKEQQDLIDVVAYSKDEYYSDMMRVSDGLADPLLVKIILKW